MPRAENTCYFATVNCASEGSPTTSAIVRPDGTLLAYQPYGEEGLLTAEIDITAATGLLAAQLAELNDQPQKSRGDQPRGSASAIPAEIRWTEFPDCLTQSRNHGFPRGNKTAYCVRGSAMPRAWRQKTVKRSTAWSGTRRDY